MAKSKTKQKVKQKAKPKLKTKTVTLSKLVDAQSKGAPPARVEIDETKPEKAAQKKEPAAVKFVKVFDAMSERVAYFLDKLKAADIAARTSASIFTGYVAIEVDASKKARAQECMYGDRVAKTGGE